MTTSDARVGEGVQAVSQVAPPGIGQVRVLGEVGRLRGDHRLGDVVDQLALEDVGVGLPAVQAVQVRAGDQAGDPLLGDHDPLRHRARRLRDLSAVDAQPPVIGGAGADGAAEPAPGDRAGRGGTEVVAGAGQGVLHAALGLVILGRVHR